MDNIKTLDRILKSYNYKISALSSILHDIQSEYSYIPAGCSKYIADELGIDEEKIENIIKTCHSISTEPVVDNIIRVCTGSFCRKRGAEGILRYAKDRVEGLNISVQAVPCLCACGLAPLVSENDKLHRNVTDRKMDEIINKISADI